MPPITIQVHATSRLTPQAICAGILEMERWPKFKGYGFLPGIKQAYFEDQTPTVVGSRIRVHNLDGSSHVEELVEWEPASTVVLKFQNFSPPLSYLAAHFIETWYFASTPTETQITRAMSLYHKNWLGQIMFMWVAPLMQKAFAQHLQQLATM
jgi:hypothetical protein